MGSYVLYYSPRDAASAQLHDEVLSMPSLLEITQVVNVDEERNLPSYVSAVPMFVLLAEKRALVGSAAMGWVEDARKDHVTASDGGGTSLGFSCLSGSGYPQTLFAAADDST